MKTRDEFVLTRSQQLGLLILAVLFIAYLVVRLRA
jgi:flagellar biogenesis protein FliO